jgi:hypothetical protein
MIEKDIFPIDTFQEGYQWQAGKHKDKGDEDEYGGCILYPYMKTEE